jgi:hypothetical protein
MRSDHIRQPVLRRQVAYDTNINIDNENMGNDLFHEVSNFADTPYTTPQATQVMGAISSNIWDDDEEDEEDEEDEDDEDDEELLTQEL